MHTDAPPICVCKPHQHPLTSIHNQAHALMPMHMDTHTLVRTYAHTSTHKQLHTQAPIQRHMHIHADAPPHTTTHMPSHADTLTLLQTLHTPPHAQHPRPTHSVTPAPPPGQHHGQRPPRRQRSVPRPGPEPLERPRIAGLAAGLAKCGSTAASERQTHAGNKSTSQENAQAKTPAKLLLFQREYFQNHLA